MGRWLAEPMVGFALIAALLLGVDAWLRPSDAVVPGPGLADAVDRAFEAQHGRAPTEVEHQAAIQAWIDDELLYREGLALGLHQGDPVIRRRVIQQVKQLQRARTGADPTDAALLALRDAWPERYTLPERMAFEHHFFAEDRAAAEAAAVTLAAGQQEAQLGRAFPRGNAEALSALDGLSRAYGSEFVVAVASSDGWVAHQSRFGWHVVRRTALQPARMPALDEIRPALLRDFQTEAADRAEVDALQRLRDGE